MQLKCKRSKNRFEKDLVETLREAVYPERRKSFLRFLLFKLVAESALQKGVSPLQLSVNSLLRTCN